MSTEQTNFLVVMSDEHTRNILGCYGNPHVRTPNMDRLAARGTLFRNAYTPCPICVPCRASFATGDYVHRIGHWDNAFPYYGEPPSWGRDLQQAGHHERPEAPHDGQIVCIRWVVHSSRPSSPD